MKSELQRLDGQVAALLCRYEWAGDFEASRLVPTPTALRRGMQFSNEPGLFDLGNGFGFNQGNNILVAEGEGLPMGTAPVDREWRLLRFQALTPGRSPARSRRLQDEVSPDRRTGITGRTSLRGAQGCHHKPAAGAA